MGKATKKSKGPTTKSKIQKSNSKAKITQKPVQSNGAGKSKTVKKSGDTSNPRRDPIIPFDPTQHILLVGEGDFSFARSLHEHYHCNDLLATSFERSYGAVIGKYPQAAGHIRCLLSDTHTGRIDGEDERKRDEDEDEDENDQGELEGRSSCQVRVEYGVDATKLGRLGTSKIIRMGGWDRIVFNFPHVGGLTKDVNRQVRANQELLVGFFKSSVPLLAPGGHIIVTVFEGEPYELWNVRDLARHSGLRVERSFVFQANAYPGYKHARTLGNIEGGRGWKGEDRPARTYILATAESFVPQSQSRRRGHDSDSDD